MAETRTNRIRWRDYRTRSGRSPVGEFLLDLLITDALCVREAMREVATLGMTSARHLSEELWEVRADGNRASYRVIFAREGSRNQVLLALVAFRKTTMKTPQKSLQLAATRLSDWRARGS